MIAIGVEIHLEILIGLHEGLGIFVGVLRMHVVVGHTVTEQQGTMKEVGTRDGVEGISFGILLRRAHVALCIDGVVETIARGRSHGHTSAEHLSTFAHAHQRAIAAIAPTPDADAVFVDVGLLAEPEGRLHLVLGFEHAQLQIGALLELGTTGTGSTTVDTNHNKALLTEVAVEESTLPHRTDVPRVGDLLASGTTILEHHHGIFLACIEVCRLHHPAFQLDAFASSKTEELLRSQLVTGELGLQVGIINTRGKDAAFLVAHGEDVRGVGIAPRVEKELVVAREHSRVPTVLIGEALGLSVLVVDEHLAVASALRSSLIEHVARLLVVAVDVGNIILPVANLPLLRAVHRVEIEVHVAIAVAGEQDVAFAHNHLAEHVLLHIFGNAFLDEQLGNGGACIHGVEVQHVLMAVHRSHDDLIGFAHREDARQIAIGVDRHLQLACLSALDVEAPSRNGGIHLAGLRIFIAVEAGIELVFGTLGLHALEELQRIFAHGFLVEAHPAEHRAIGREAEGAVVLELLFVDPVGDAVDDLVELSVLRHLALGVVVEQFHEEEVVVANEGHLQAVGAPQGNLLLAAVGEALQLAAFDGVDIIVGLERTTVDGLGVRLDEHTGAIGRHHIAVEALNLLTLRLLNIEEHTCLLPRLERILHNSLAVA